MARLSTGLAKAMVDSTGFNGKLTTGVIDVFPGTMPADAKDAISGTMLVRITKASGAWVAGTATNGLVMDATDNVLGIHAGDTWSGVATASGTAGFAVFKGNPADNNGSSTTLARALLSVGVGTGEVQLSHIDITTSATVSVPSITLPQPRV